MVPQTFRHKTTFTDVAAEFFIAPLVNRFWLFLRNEQTREARTAHQEPLYRYKGAGTGLIFNPMVLTHFLRTLAVLVHAAQNAPQWLAIVAPDALELAVTLGAKPGSQVEDDEDISERQANNGNRQEASVLSTALELILVVLDGCLELDGGRSLGLEHTALLLGAGEWAGNVFSRLEKGRRVEGGGGAQEVKLKRAAAGVLLKVDELTSRWRRSMVDVS
jgi:telomere length regulation protein